MEDNSKDENLWPKSPMGVANFLTHVGFPYTIHAIRHMADEGLIPSFISNEGERRIFSKQDKEYFILTALLRVIGASTQEIRSLNHFLYELNPNRSTLGFEHKDLPNISSRKQEEAKILLADLANKTSHKLEQVASLKSMLLDFSKILKTKK